MLVDLDGIIYLNEKNDDEVFKGIYEKYSRMMYFIALKILEDEYLAEDAMQNTFLSFFSKGKLKLFEDDEEGMKHYLAKSVINNSKNIKRNIYTQSRYMENDYSKVEEKTSNYTVEMSVEDAINCRKLIKTLEELPEIYYDVIIEHTIKGKNCHVIARQFGIKPETVKKRVYRARKLLKQKLLAK